MQPSHNHRSAATVPVSNGDPRGVTVSIGGPTPPPDHALPRDAPPPDVDRVAQQRGFGPLLSSRALPHPGKNALGKLAAGVVCFVLLMVFASVIPELSIFSFMYSVARFIGLVFCFAGVFFFVVALRVLVIGARAYYAYANGFVYRHNSRIQAFGWHEATELRPLVTRRGDNAGKVLEYELVGPAGPIVIPLQIVNGRDEFMDHMIPALGRFGKPVR
jgi:hypothetical protein